MTRYWREIWLGILGLGCMVALAVVGPIAQPADYHAFADSRGAWGLPNALNVLSNLPFLLVGLYGLRLLRRREIAGARASWCAFFFWVASIAVGSAYYHWAPTDTTLVWDRLPMALAAMALFNALLCERLAALNERVALAGLSLVGLASVAYWHFSGDVRFYVWVQFYPLLAIPWLLMLYPSTRGERIWVGAGVALYVVAKLAEHYDAVVFTLSGGALSGHSVKHLIAALALFCVAGALAPRGVSGAAARAPASAPG